MDDLTKEAFEGAVSLCLVLYGERETRIIMAEVEEKVTASGLDGAFLRDWLIHIKQSAVARHPDTASLWEQLNLEKHNGRAN